jgi:hypothetical protein
MVDPNEKGIDRGAASVGNRRQIDKGAPDEQRAGTSHAACVGTGLIGYEPKIADWRSATSAGGCHGPSGDIRGRRGGSSSY